MQRMQKWVTLILEHLIGVLLVYASASFSCCRLPTFTGVEAVAQSSNIDLCWSGVGQNGWMHLPRTIDLKSFNAVPVLFLLTGKLNKTSRTG